MHRSKFAGFIIDCHTDDLESAATFWSGALGLARKEPVGAVEDDLYRRLDDRQLGLNIEVQQVDHASRVHLDIETDDMEAEVMRLEQLGARRVSWIKTWWVMEAPTGQRFCVVHASSPNFAKLASKWP